MVYSYRETLFFLIRYFIHLGCLEFIGGAAANKLKE
jgi:hypothetical protein